VNGVVTETSLRWDKQSGDTGTESTRWVENQERWVRKARKERVESGVILKKEL
jgi:hypothetical protein